MLRIRKAFCFTFEEALNRCQEFGLYNTLLKRTISPASKLHYSTGAAIYSTSQSSSTSNTKTLQSSLEKLASLDWDSWPLNYPKELLKVIGFQQSLKNNALLKEDELYGCTYTRKWRQIHEKKKKHVYKIWVYFHCMHSSLHMYTGSEHAH